ncbi:MAG: MFS transporter [Chloroflexi bacterium]|nr:MFS transporter [Chloroflexota bacterium]
MNHADQPAAEPSGLRRRALWVISMVSALYGVQVGMLLPLVPLYVLSLGYSFAWLGAVIAAQGAFQFLLRFFGGALSDRFGERVVLRVGLLAVVMGALLFVTSESVWALIGAQLFIGVARAIYNPAAQSYATRISETDRARIIGRYRAAEALGQGAGPLLSGIFIWGVGFDAGFMVVVAGSVAALLASLLLPELPRRTAVTLIEVFRAIPGIVRSRALLLAGICAFGLSVSVAVLMSVGIAFFSETGIDEVVIGLAATVFTMAAAIGSYGFGRIMTVLGQRLVFVLGVGGVGVMWLSIAGAGGSMIVLLPAMLLGGVAASLGNNLRTLLSAEHSAPEQRGLAMALVGSYWALAQLVVPAVLGVVASLAGLTTALVAGGGFALLVGVSAPLLFRLLLPRAQAPAESAGA